MKRSGFKTRAKPMRRISPEEAAKRLEWRKITDRRMRETYGKCEANIQRKCWGSASHGHHILPRGRGGENTYENCAVVCLSCHGFIHEHPNEAVKLGLLKRGKKKITVSSLGCGD